MKELNKKNAYLENGDPRYVRCYFKKSDNFEPFCVVFTETKKLKGRYICLGMNKYGDYSHFECDFLQGLGKKISWQGLPEDCKQTVLVEYIGMYGKIVNVKLAEEWAATVQGVPSFAEYLEGLKQFLKESASWYGLEACAFYSVNDNGYYKSCDNTYGGLDVSWAFYSVRKAGRAKTLREAKAQYVQLCEELRVLLEESEE